MIRRFLLVASVLVVGGCTVTSGTGYYSRYDYGMRYGIYDVHHHDDVDVDINVNRPDRPRPPHGVRPGRPHPPVAHPHRPSTRPARAPRRMRR